MTSDLTHGRLNATFFFVVFALLVTATSQLESRLYFDCPVSCFCVLFCHIANEYGSPVAIYTYSQIHIYIYISLSLFIHSSIPDSLFIYVFFICLCTFNS